MERKGAEVINVIWNIALPGSGKTLVSGRDVELLKQSGYAPTFCDDKHALDEAVWEDAQRYIHEPSRRTPQGGIIGEHSIIYNPDDGIGLFKIDFLDGHALNQGHEKLLNNVQQFIRNSDGTQILVVEWALGVDDHSYGPNKEPVIQNPAWLRDQLIKKELLDFSLIQEIIADEPIRVKRNSERPVHIPDDLFVRIFPDVGGRFTDYDRLVFGNRYTQLINNGNTVDSLMKLVDERYHTFLYPRLTGEGQQMNQEFLNMRTRR